MDDLISRQALCDYALNQKDKSVTPNDIMRFPSAQPDHDNLHPKKDPNFSSCSHCVHSEDSEEICVLRKCVHAIAELKECYKER